VVSVKLDKPVPVYDLEVSKWHNFALSGGVFVHNSKDCTDAIAAVCFRMLEHTPMERPMMMRGHAPLVNDPVCDAIEDIRIRKAVELDMDPAAVQVTFDDILFSDAYLED
jgi:hypothetical protein